MSRPSYILGISAFYHDSAAALLKDGEIVAACQEERFSRRKNDDRFPARSIAACLNIAGAELRDVDAVVFYEKPLWKFDRVLQTHMHLAPRGLRQFAGEMPRSLREKVYLKSLLRKELAALGGMPKSRLPKLLFCEHHRAHAAAAFYPSPFPEAAVLCLDGVGEWATTSAWRAEGAGLKPLWEIRFPHSLGLLYSAFTAYCGFKIHTGEYKLMGLAAYGEPKYKDVILENLIDVKDDGTFRLNLDYFDLCGRTRITNGKFHRLFGGPPRAPEGPLTTRDMDVARSIQAVTEDVILRLSRAVQRETGSKFLCLAGGVALNCVANGKLLREGLFEDVWIQPAAGDAGGALGAALTAWHEHYAKPRGNSKRDAMNGSLLGKRYGDEEIRRQLDAAGATYRQVAREAAYVRAAELLKDGRAVGWFQGRSEFGPRALGARSILADPRDSGMMSRLNLKIKFRESFRPFAPAVLAEEAENYFEIDRESPYMLLAAPVAHAQRLEHAESAEGLARLKTVRSTIPAVTHVDDSARLQTVDGARNPDFHALLKTFHSQTGCPVLVNTSFNVRGEPIVETPADAYRCFMKTDIDALIIEDFVLLKGEQRGRAEEKPEPVAPRERLRRAKVLFMRFSSTLEGIYAFLFLTALFFVVLTPVALVMRIFDGSRREWRRDARLLSYRQPPLNAGASRMEKTF